jgi:ferritin-like metal-binding protein YciE
MKLETLRKLYVTELRELYNAEKQIKVGLTKMAARASHPQLKQAFEQHRMETDGQISRLKQIFERLGESPKGETSRATLGLLAEGDKIIKSRGDADVIDAGLIGGAQKIEHSEIACYGTAIAHAKKLGDQMQAIQLLQQNLDEEYAFDKKLTAMAEESINTEASYSSAYDYQGNGSYSNDNGSAGMSVTGLLLGAAAGIAVGMLLAPSAGTDTRRKFMDGANSLVNQLGGQFSTIADAVRPFIDKFAGNGMSGQTAGNGNAGGPQNNM